MKEQGEPQKPPRLRSASPKKIEDKYADPPLSPVKLTQLTGARAAAHFESSSKDFDKIMKVLGRNRKYLVDVFTKVSKIKVVVLYHMCIAADLRDSAGNSGVALFVSGIRH